ncbi:MAG: hypothetical protein ACM3UU_08245 [Ignavibacteriales bacterium]
MKENKKFLEYFGSTTFKILSTFLVIIVSALIAYLQNILNEKSFLIAAIFLVFICLCSIAIYAGYAQSRTEEKYIDRIDIITEFIKSNGLGYIVNEHVLADWEENASNIWVVTPDMTNDLINTTSPIFKAVHDNLARGTKYLYYVPNNRKMIGTLNEFKTSVHKNVYKQGQVKVCLIDEGDFNFISEVVLYDVDEDIKTKALQMFPNDMKNYYMAMDEDYIRSTVGILTDLKNRFGVKDIESVCHE